MEKTTLFTGAQIIDSCSDAPLSGHDLLIEGKTIKAIFPSGSQPVPDQCERVDCQGKTIMPGLINCHCHLRLNPKFPQPLATYGPANAQLSAFVIASSVRDSLKAGITYVRDCGGWPFYNIFAKQAVQQRMIPGAEVQACGQMLAMTGGHCWNIGARQCDGEAEMRKGAREQIVAGADFLKIMATGGYSTLGAHPKAPQLTVAEMRAAVEVAHQAGKKTTAHVYGAQGMMNALEAGIDTIEHGEMFPTDDEALQERVIETMLKNKVHYVPTLMAYFDYYEDEFTYRGPIHKEYFERPIPRQPKTVNDPSHWQEEIYCLMETADSMRKIIKAGVPTAVGTDSGYGFVCHDGLAFEIKLMTFLGMTPMESIVAATKTGAANLGIDSAYGTLEPGKVADLMIVSGDPLEDLDVLWTPYQVYKWGELVTL